MLKKAAQKELLKVLETRNYNTYNHRHNDFRRKTIKKKLQSESQISKKLAKRLHGLTEVITPAGRIDILTSTELIEVKQVKDWKEAVGQVIIYGKYYPSHWNRIHLFGLCHSSYLKLIENHCQEINIKVSVEN